MGDCIELMCGNSDLTWMDVFISDSVVKIRAVADRHRVGSARHADRNGHDIPIHIYMQLNIYIYM